MVELLHPVEVARRWRITEKTLAQWRWRGKGPRYVKIGGRILYDLEDVKRHEARDPVRGAPGRTGARSEA